VNFRLDDRIWALWSPNRARNAIAVSAVSNTRTGEVVFEVLLTYNDPSDRNERQHPTISRIAGARMGKQLDVFRAVVILACGGLAVACSQAPPEAAPVFTLPLSKVVGAPPVEGQPAASDAPATRQLRYVAVPPGQQVAGMAHARIVTKQKATRHRPGHAHKKSVARAAAVKKPTETTEPAAKP
jgi:hypothetical protein